MRRFLIEMEQEITLEEIRRDYYEKFANTEEISFDEYLEWSMYWNNGALTEILTENTPRELAGRAVGQFWVTDAETGNGYWEWLPMSTFELFAAI